MLLDWAATVLLDALALAGIISIIPHAKDDLVGTVAVILAFALLGVAYTGVVIRKDRKKLKQE